jgi:hypothetical protein
VKFIDRVKGLRPALLSSCPAAASDSLGMASCSLLCFQPQILPRFCSSSTSQHIPFSLERTAELLFLLNAEYFLANMATDSPSHDHLIKSTDSQHPANLICTLCEKFYHLGWVAGTGGGTSIRDE